MARRVTINRLVQEDVAEGERPKPVVYFDEQAKGCVLNKTNKNNLVAIMGTDYTTWPGKTIELYPCNVDYKGQSVLAIRMRQHVPPAAAAPTSPPAPVVATPTPAAEAPTLPATEAAEDLPTNWG